MAEHWQPASAQDVVVGDRIRLRGTELTVARIEPGFLGRSGMIAFIEDTPQRWMKVPAPADAEVEIYR